MNPSDPAFPKQLEYADHCPECRASLSYLNAGGMTSQAYAAIHLRVPDSGEAWLDKMIVESLRDELAGKAMQGLLSNEVDNSNEENPTPICSLAHQIAKAMLKQRGKK